MLATAGQRTRRTWLRELWDSTIGKKVLVAVSGAVLIGYVILHMVGNLNSLYGAGDGEPRVDGYSDWLRSFGEPILPYATIVWAIRVLLLVAIVVHITGVVQLRARSRVARGGYPARRIGRTFSSATMMVSGSLLLFFIVFHILQFTTLTIDITPLHHGEVYGNLYAAFQKWYFVLFYVAAVCALGFHLRHAVWSAAQTLGLDRPERNRVLRRTASGLAVVIVLGFISVPLAFWTGILDAPRDEGAHASATPTVVTR